MAIKPDWKGAETAFEALSLNAILQMPGVKLLASVRQPITKKARRRIHAAVTEAIKTSMEPGVVVRIACDTMAEVVYCSGVVKAVFDEIDKSPRRGFPHLIRNKSTETQFELSNNSAIMLNRKHKDD